MSGILRLENLNKGTTLKQGDKTVLSYRLSDADGEQLNIAGNTAIARLMHPDFIRIGYESEALTVSTDNTVQFSIDSIIPSRLYYLEITVDGQYIFPSRSDEGKLSIDRSSMGAEITIIENAGIDAVVRKAVDLINEDPSLIIDEDKLISDIIANTSVGSIEEYYQEYRDAIREYADLKPKAVSAVSKSEEALTKSQNALNVANGIDAKATNALSLSESADTLSKSVQEQFNQVVIDGDSSVESAQARVNTDGVAKATLKQRLDDEHTEVTAQLAQTTSNRVYVESFKREAGETDDTARIQRAINEAGMSGVVEFKKNTTYQVKGTIKPISFQTWECSGVTFKGDDTNVGIHFEGTLASSCSGITINGLTLQNFDIAVKMTTYYNPDNGCYYNNFNDMRVLFNRIGFDMGDNSNINNIIGGHFQTNRDYHIKMDVGGVKNNIAFTSIEGNESSTGILNNGQYTTIIACYFEHLKYAIDGENRLAHIISPFIAGDIENEIPTTWYATHLGNEKSNFFPFLQLGDIKIKQTGDQLIIEEMNTTKSAFLIPMLTRFTKGVVEIQSSNPELRLVDTGVGGGTYRLRSAVDVLRFVNKSNAQIAHMNSAGNFHAFNGVNGGSFTTANRPTTNLTVGTMIFDSTLGKPIWCKTTGTTPVWVDSMGATV